MITETFARSCYKARGVLFGLIDMRSIQEVFGDNLRFWLESQGRKQKWLAEQLGIATSSITRWKDGEAMPGKAEHFDKLAEIMGIPVSLLFVEDGVKSPDAATKALAEMVSKP